MASTLTSELVKEYGLSAGATVVGIAASKDFDMAPEGFKPSDNLEGCLSVIVLGVTFPHEVLSSTIEYTASRNAMTTKATDLAKEVAKRMKADGYRTKAISATGGKWVANDGRKEQHGFISLKHAAMLAGLGIIGNNYLLTNPVYGNHLWFSAVLTDADLKPDDKALDILCDSCNRCVDACPTGALDNPTVFGREDCSKFFVMVDRKLEIKCFACRTVCPYSYGV